MDGLVIFFGLAVIVTVVFAVLILLSLRSSDKEGSPARLDRPARQAAKDRKSWIFYFGIALFIAVWTMWGALLFLMFIWLLRIDPKPYTKETPFPTDVEKKTAKRLYIWLLLSPFIAVPIFLLAALDLSYSSSINERVMVAFIPLIIHTPLLFGFTTESLFVFRHTQQAILLIALRAATACFAISIGDLADGFWVFLIGNGVLWLGGSFLGLDQIKQGRCWLLERKGEKIASPETGKTDPSQMDKELEDMLRSLNAKDQLIAKTKALHAFRAGAPETKRRAVEVLSKLGEVEEF